METLIEKMTEKILVAVLCSIAAAFIFLPILFVVGFHHETGRGEHTGYVTAVETNGIVFKTNRAYLKTDTQSSQEDAYCVSDGAVYSQLQQYAISKTRVNVFYFSWISPGIATCQGENAIIYKVEAAAL